MESIAAAHSLVLGSFVDMPFESDELLNFSALYQVDVCARVVNFVESFTFVEVYNFPEVMMIIQNMSVFGMKLLASHNNIDFLVDNVLLDDGHCLIETLLGQSTHVAIRVASNGCLPGFRLI